VPCDSFLDRPSVGVEARLCRIVPAISTAFRSGIMTDATCVTRCLPGADAVSVGAAAIGVFLQDPGRGRALHTHYHARAHTGAFAASSIVTG
jgi:hypothetical protein